MHKRELLVGVTAPALLALFVLLSLSSSVVAQVPESGPSWGPETPDFNLEVILRGEGEVRVVATIWPRFPATGALGRAGGNGASLKP